MRPEFGDKKLASEKRFIEWEPAMVNGEDATEPIRRKAGGYPNVEAGTSCTQQSFKTGKKAFLYIGLQGGRHKAMFKLGPSLLEATKLAQQHPSRFQVGSTAWVTARFTDSQPLPSKLWRRWLEESYQLTVALGSQKAVGKNAKKKIRKKK